MVSNDPYRKLFLDSVERILQESPSNDGLMELLQLATPDLDAAKCYDSTQRRKLFRTLLTRIHPDKHPNDMPRATKLTQDAQYFFSAVAWSPPVSPTSGSFRSKRRWSTSTPTSVMTPFDFDCLEKWPCLARQCQYPLVNDKCEQEGGRLVAYQCINARGGIAHGKATELLYTLQQEIKLPAAQRTVHKIFELNGGVKELSSFDDIKEELMTRGPVVSTSFRPSHALLIKSPSLRNQTDFLIVGWKHTRFGEVWLIQPLCRDKNVLPPVVPVALGQFGVDERIVAPKSTFEHKSWEGGPYLDATMNTANTKWRFEWPGIDLKVSSGELDSLLRQMGTLDFMMNKKPPLTLRDAGRHSHSRKGCLRKMEWVDGRWKLSIVFTS